MGKNCTIRNGVESSLACKNCSPIHSYILVCHHINKLLFISYDLLSQAQQNQALAEAKQLDVKLMQTTESDVLTASLQSLIHQSADELLTHYSKNVTFCYAAIIPD